MDQHPVGQSPSIFIILMIFSPSFRACVYHCCDGMLLKAVFAGLNRVSSPSSVRDHCNLCLSTITCDCPLYLVHIHLHECVVVLSTFSVFWTCIPRSLCFYCVEYMCTESNVLSLHLVHVYRDHCVCCV